MNFLTFDSAYNILDIGVALINRSGDIIRVNNKLCVLFDYTKESLLGTKLCSLISEVSDSKCNDYIEDIFSNENEETVKREYEVYNSTGQKIKVHISFLKTDEQDQIVVTFDYIKIVEDIIEKSNIRMLYDNMSEGYLLHKIIKDDNNNIVDYIFIDANHITENLLGYKRDYFLGKTIKDAFPQLADFWLGKVKEAVSNGKTLKMTHRSKFFNKSFELRVYFPNEDYFVGIFKDITQEVIAEKELEFYNRMLESVVNLSRQKASNYIEVLTLVIKEAITLVNGVDGAFYYFSSDEGQYHYKPLRNSDSNRLSEKYKPFFKEVLDSKKIKLVSQNEFLEKGFLRDAEFNALLLIPVKSLDIATVVFGIAIDTDKLEKWEIKNLKVFFKDSMHIVEKQKYQDVILAEKLRAEVNEQRLQEVQKAGDIGWYEAIIDDDSFIASRQAFDIFFDKQYDPPISNEFLISSVHPDDREFFINTVKDNIEKKVSVFEWEYRVITPKTRVKHIFSRAYMNFDENGKLTRRYGVVQDITKTKKIELELIKHNKRLENLYSVIQGSFETKEELLKRALDIAIDITGCSGGMIFSYSAKQNKLSAEVKYKDTSVILEEVVTKAISNSDTEIFDFFTRCEYKFDNALKEGTTVLSGIFDISKGFSKGILVPQKGASGNSLWIALVHRFNDFSDNDAKELVLLLDSVWKVIERKEYQDELIKAKEKAEESDKLKSAFLANMSHEIRTPMNGIIGFSELFVQENISPEKRRSYANIVIESGKQLLGIVNDILDFSKIEVGQLTLTKTEVNINEIITELFSFYTPRARNSNIYLFPYKELEDSQAVVETDRQRLLQVLNNLLTNAFKFTHEGEIEFGYYVREGFIEFYVRDTGIGIPKEMQKLVFERFRQVDDNKTLNFRGTGLGLSISQKLVELMGGEIWLESEQGNGTIFYFTIPFSGNISKHSQNNDKPLVIVAEDEEVNYMYFHEVLTKEGLKVLHAKTGKEVVELSKKHPHANLIFMDIKLPELDGLSATSQIRMFNTTVPIIAVTAFAMDEDREKAFLAGCTAHYSKPLNFDTILHIIEKYINK